MPYSIPPLLWCDIETSGLDPGNHEILEVAAMVTDSEMRVTRTFHELIRPRSWNWDPWCLATHAQNGLAGELRMYAEADAAACDAALRSFIDAAFPGEERVQMAGLNPMALDRRFIDQHLPRSAERLHYRCVDVNTLRTLFGPIPGPKDGHRALDDLARDIEATRRYIGRVRSPGWIERWTNRIFAGTRR